jgi:hypothetical protein
MNQKVILPVSMSLYITKSPPKAVKGVFERGRVILLENVVANPRETIACHRGKPEQHKMTGNEGGY